MKKKSDWPWAECRAGIYARLAEAMRSGSPISPDFNHAVTRHRLIDAMERSSSDGWMVKLI